MQLIPSVDENGELQNVAQSRNGTIELIDADIIYNKKLFIELVYSKLSSKYKLFFGNGGDQNNESIPEKPICEKLGIDLVDRLGNKIQSSSWLLGNK